MNRSGLCECGCGQTAPLATRNNPRYGHVTGQPVRFVAGHNSKVGRPPEYRVEDRGYSSPCWAWQRTKTQSGYGQVRLDGRGAQAHRVYYERVKGPIPDGLQIDHLCRVRECVNPDHLEPVTGAENIRRAPNTKLTFADAEAIRSSKGRTADLAARYGVSTSVIKGVRAGRTWKAA